MNSVDSLISSFREAKKLRKVIGLIYLIQLGLAMFVGIFAGRYISKLNHSLNQIELLFRYDYSVLEDLKSIFPSDYGAITTVALLMIVAYMLIATFIQSGLLYSIYHRRYNFNDFKQGVKCYYRRFIGVGIFFWILAIGWTLVIWIPYMSNLFHMVEYWVAEYMIVWLFAFLGILYFIGLSFLFAWSTQTRYIMIYQSHWSWSVFKRGYRQVIARVGDHSKTMLLYLLILIIGYCIYFLLERFIGISGVGLVLMFLIIQQAWVMAKIWHRTAVYISIRNLQKIIRTG